MIIRGIFLLAIIFSISVCFVKPKMHTTFFVYNSEYEIVKEKSPKVEKIEPEIKVTTKYEKKEIKKSTVKTVSNKSVQPVKQIQTTKKAVNSVQKIIKQEKPKEEIKTVKKIEPIQTKQEQEEIIAWNKWHSDIQNSIMRDTKMPYVPDGVRFNFTFTVDKYGKISNIKTWSDNPKYNIYAVQYIAPVIKSYQGKSILNFPSNSQRFTTEFIGKFKIANIGQNKYSSASDFNDTEKIRK